MSWQSEQHSLNIKGSTTRATIGKTIVQAQLVRKNLKQRLAMWTTCAECSHILPCVDTCGKLHCSGLRCSGQWIRGFIGRWLLG